MVSLIRKAFGFLDTLAADAVLVAQIVYNSLGGGDGGAGVVRADDAATAACGLQSLHSSVTVAGQP